MGSLCSCFKKNKTIFKRQYYQQVCIVLDVEKHSHTTIIKNILVLNVKKYLKIEK